MERKFRIAMLLLMAIAVVASLYIVVQRVEIEQGDQNLDVAVEWVQLQSFAERQGLTDDEALAMLQDKVTAIIFKEQVFSELLTKGQATAYSPVDLRFSLARGEVDVRDENGVTLSEADVSLESNYYIFASEAALDSVVWNLDAKRMGEYQTYVIENGGQVFPFLETNFPIATLLDVGVGFDQESMEKVASFGFRVIPQFRSWPSYQEGDMAKLLEPFVDLPMSCVLFNDVSLPGMELEGEDLTAALQDMAQGFSALDVPVATIEFYNQKGMSSLLAAYENEMVRLHVITDTEMTTMTKDKALDRYLLAVNERNIRVLFVKFFTTMDFESNVDFLATLDQALVDDGFTLAAPVSIPDVPNNLAVLFLIALGIAAGGVCLLDLLRLRKAGLVLAALLLLGVLGLVVLDRSTLAAKGLALLAALIFPTLGVFRYAGGPRNLWHSVIAFFKITGISLMGAAFVVGLLGDKIFMVRLDAFSGTKIALAGPILLLFLLLILYKAEEKPWQRAWKIFNEPVRNGYLLLGLLFCVVILIFLLRSGNDGLSATSIEMVIRTKLDQWLVVRPRTKEFLLGHPAMLLALYYGYKDRFLPLWIMGIIGQVSIINTFCHLHTPILISLLRTFNGIWIGLLIGMALLGFVMLIIKYYKKMRIKGNGVI